MIVRFTRASNNSARNSWPSGFLISTSLLFLFLPYTLLLQLSHWFVSLFAGRIHLLRIYGPCIVVKELGIAWSIYAISGLFDVGPISPSCYRESYYSSLFKSIYTGVLERDRREILQDVGQKDAEEAKGSERGGIPGTKCISVDYLPECR
jgi:hypothetical protein